MPEEKKTTERAEQGEKAPTTQAGEMIREEMHALGKKGARAPRTRKQAVAIGLSRARRAGIPVPVPRRGEASEGTRRKATQDLRKGKEASEERRPSRRARPQAAEQGEKKEGTERKTAARKTATRKAPARRSPARRPATAASKGGAARRARSERSAGTKRAASTKKAAAPRKRRQEEGGS